MAACFEEKKPDIIGNDYLVMGVIETKDWREGKKGKILDIETIDRMSVFKDVLNFEPAHFGWYPEEENE